MTPLEALQRGATLKQIVQHYEKEILKEMIGATGGSRKKMAILACITLQGLKKKLEKYELSSTWSVEEGLSAHSESPS